MNTVPPYRFGDETLCPTCHPHKFSDFDIIVDADIIDIEGNPVRGGDRRSVSTHMSNGIATSTRKFTLYNCPGTADLRIRYTIAMAPYKMPIPLTLTEIPIPGL